MCRQHVFNIVLLDGFWALPKHFKMNNDKYSKMYVRLNNTQNSFVFPDISLKYTTITVRPHVGGTSSEDQIYENHNDDDRWHKTLFSPSFNDTLTLTKQKYGNFDNEKIPNFRPLFADNGCLPDRAGITYRHICSLTDITIAQEVHHTSYTINYFGYLPRKKEIIHKHNDLVQLGTKYRYFVYQLNDMQ